MKTALAPSAIRTIIKSISTDITKSISNCYTTRIHNIKLIYMTLHQQIRGEIKKAMLAKDTLRLDLLRGILSAFMNEVVAQKRKPQEELTDEDALSVIKRAVKQRKDSIKQFVAGGRSDLASSEEAELQILQIYLPETMSKEEIKIVAEQKKAELGITDTQKLGMLVGAVMKELKGKADGGNVKEVVESLF